MRQTHHLSPAATTLAYTDSLYINTEPDLISTLTVVSTLREKVLTMLLPDNRPIAEVYFYFAATKKVSLIKLPVVPNMEN